MHTMLQRFSTLTLLCLLWAITLNADIKDTYLLRQKGSDCLRAKKIDSASFYFSKLIKDTVHANATDYMSLSCVKLLLKDTGAFKKHLMYSIEQDGADSAMVMIYFRPLDTFNLAYFKNYLATIYSVARALFLKKVDPAIEKEMKDILYLDQICRGPDDRAYIDDLHRHNDSLNPNFDHLRFVGGYIDSVNYERIVALIKRHKYPGYHNFGITSANYNVILMHVSDHSEDRWNFIFNFLKQEVMSGDIMPNEVVAIATRHYQYKKCTYYGSIKWGLTSPCDCAHVDQLRAEIGLDNLKQEYQRLQQKLPDCYHEQ